MNLKKILPLEINFEIKNFKEYLKKRTIKLENNNRQRIFFLDAASYNNLGDQAISFAISKYIIDNFKDYEYIEVLEKEFLRNLRYLKKNINKNDIICLAGGGNMGNLYPRYEAIRRKVIKNFKNNKIVIFPQTIDYENDKYGRKELNRSRKVYNSNPNLIVCAREKKSYNIMKNLYTNVILVSDIVFYLYGKLDDKVQNIEKNKIGICLRDDKESIFNERERNNIINSIHDINSIIYLSTMSDIQYIDKKNRKKVLMDKLREFKKCNIVLTDRLHGMIFSILCDIPCIVFDNSNKKVSGVLEMISNYNVKVKKLNKQDINKISNYININYQKNVRKNKEFDIFEELTKNIELET